MAVDNSKLQVLTKILERERDTGFHDLAVVGGLDRFLQRWARELAPVLEELSSYSVLTPAQREVWATDCFSRLGHLSKGGGNGEAADSTAATPPRPGAKRRRTAESLSASARLGDGVTRISGVSSKYLSKLKHLGVDTVEDLLYLFPHRHNDFANIRKVAGLEIGKEQTVVVTVWEAEETRHGPKRRSTQAVLGDDTGNVRAIWFNQPYLARTFRTGTQLVISGKVNVFRGRFVFESPEYELLQGQEELVHTGRLVPVYPTVDGLPQRTLRRVVRQALKEGIPLIVDYLPEDSRHRTGLMGLQNAISQAHYPDTATEWIAARRRLAFDELFMLQLAVLTRKRAWQQSDRGIPLKVDPLLMDAFLASLPFELTGAQSRVLKEILDDLEQKRPMSRLLQGDVGSGKTVVATAALLVAAFNSYQGVLMAPTEILAEQHFLTIYNLLSGVSEIAPDQGLVTVKADAFPRPVNVALLIGSLPKKVKEGLHRRIADGQVDLVVGTQALIQEEVELPYLALAVVDEQHRFGVMQRATMRSKGRRPHLLAMSATPIPRSLALTLYGELDISVIDEMPPGRRRIRTRWVEPRGRAAAYNFVRKQVEQRRQAFVVCPLIDGSEAIQTRAATVEYERLSKDVFPELSLGLLHGRMALSEKEQVMELFKRGELDIMVSTPVIEVGIDVPNATVMLVDGADRFGLAQLHQFRGRVGRGRHQSYCLLLADSPGQEARERLKIVERVQDGFDLAEEDLRLRGPGDYLGTRQSGLPQLKVARVTDHELLSLARQEAIRLLDADPDLKKGENALLSERMKTHTAGLVDELS